MYRLLRAFAPLIAWLRAARAFSFTATLIPVSLAAVIAHEQGIRTDWILFSLTLLGGLLINAASDLTNDYYDHINGIDKKGSLGGSGVIQEGSLKPEQLRRAYILCYLLAALLGSYFIYLRGPFMAAIIVAGFAAGYAYTGGRYAYKYFALGEPMCFLFYGPLMAVGAYLAITGKYSAAVALASIPVGFLVAAILNGNNLRDAYHDRKSKILTIDVMLGQKNSRILYSVLLLSSYLAVSLMAYYGVVTAWSLLVFLTLPQAVYLIKRAYAADEKELLSIDIGTALLHLAFGSVYLASFLVK